MFLQISNVFAERVSPNRQTRFLQIVEHVFSKSPMYFATCFSKSPTYFATCFSKSPKIFLQISKIFCRSASSLHSFLFSLEKTQSLIPPFTCHGLRALRYGWSAAVPWSCLFLLHVHELRARCYRLWATQGQEPSKELTARTSLILCISPSYFTKRRAAYIPLCSPWRRPSLRSLPTCAVGSALCVMGGRLWFLGHACSSYTCTGSTLNVIDYGLAKTESSVKN